jgi:hypothetical protein
LTSYILSWCQFVTIVEVPGASLIPLIAFVVLKISSVCDVLLNL